VQNQNFSNTPALHIAPHVATKGANTPAIKSASDTTLSATETFASARSLQNRYPPATATKGAACCFIMNAQPSNSPAPSASYQRKTFAGRSNTQKPASPNSTTKCVACANAPSTPEL